MRVRQSNQIFHPALYYLARHAVILLCITDGVDANLLEGREYSRELDT
jgi:hypothetical protein